MPSRRHIQDSSELPELFSPSALELDDGCDRRNATVPFLERNEDARNVDLIGRDVQHFEHLMRAYLGSTESSPNFPKPRTKHLLSDQTFQTFSNLFKPFQTFPNLLRSRYYDCRLLISRNPQDRFISTSQRARWREADRRNPSRPRSPHQRLLHFPLLSPASRRLSSLCERARTSSSGRPRWRKTPNSWATWR